MQFDEIVKHGMKFLHANATEIFTVAGIAGVTATGYLAAKAGYESCRVVSAEERTRPVDPENTTRKDLFVARAKLTWRIYIPPVATGVLTAGSIVGLARTGNRRVAAAVAAYSLSEKAFSQYKEKVVEQIGKNKEQKITDELAKEKLIAKGGKEVIIAGSGNVLCCELHSGRYFESSMESLRKAENAINWEITHARYVTLDEFYDLIGLEHTAMSNTMGWDSDKLLELKFTTILSPNGIPCLAFDYDHVKQV